MEDYDIKIIVGKEPNIEEFKAHSTILSSKSIYFRNALSSRWVKREDGIIIFYKSNILPLVFEVLIKYIYKGILSVENNEINLMDVIIAADELKLLEVHQQLENRFLENKLNWKPKEIITALQHDRFTNLYNFALGIIYRNPIIIFESEDFSKIKEVQLIQLLKNPTSKLSFDVLPLRGYPFDSNIINAKDAALIAREIIGGYNPLEWRSIKIEGDETSRLLSHNQDFYYDYKCKASNSFIFSLTNQNFPILSQISSKEEAIIWCRNKGPCFGLRDLCIKPLRPSNNFNVICESRQHSYEKKIINGGTFEIEEYEVFQIDKGFSYYRMFQFIMNYHDNYSYNFALPLHCIMHKPDLLRFHHTSYIMLWFLTVEHSIFANRAVTMHNVHNAHQ
ncbi:unnamed protein product [Rhizophagus irregularis]|nr:unnamed protein product [Rhizophagus irregularis]